MNTLQIIESAYRCTIEEQDDPAVWIVHAIKNANAELSVLLRGNAVNYVVQSQDASGLLFGEVSQAHPPRIDNELDRLIAGGTEVYVVEEDLQDRGIESGDIMPGIATVPRRMLPELFVRHDQIWHW